MQARSWLRNRKRGPHRAVCCGACVRFWHKADTPRCPRILSAFGGTADIRQRRRLHWSDAIDPYVVGWDRGADRASNDADVSSTLPIIPYGGFSPVRLEGWLSKRCLPGSFAAYACSRHTLSVIQFASALRAPRSDNGCPALCRAAHSIAHRLGGLLLLRPRGPRSGSSYAVSDRHHLIDPIRPARKHIAISPHGGLYAMPSLCGSASATRERFRAFVAHSVLACRPL